MRWVRGTAKGREPQGRERGKTGLRVKEIGKEGKKEVAEKGIGKAGKE